MQDLIVSAIDILGAGAFSRYNLDISVDAIDKNAAFDLQDIAQAQGSEKSSIAGLLLQRLISEPPASLQSDSTVQHIYFSIVERLLKTLQGGSPSKRVLGNLTNALTTFCLPDLAIRKRLWMSLGKFQHIVYQVLGTFLDG
jgi:hypothetical protein